MKKEQINKIFVYILIVTMPLAWGSTAIGSIYRIITLVIIFGWFAINHKIVIPKERKNIFLWWTIYIIYTCMTVLWTVNMASSITNIFGAIILYLSSLIFFATRFDHITMRNIRMCFLIDTIMLIGIFFMGSTKVIMYTGRKTLVLFGTATDANEFAGFFVIGIMVVLYNLFSTKVMINKMISIGIALVSIYIILLSGSRGALVSIIVSVTLFLYKKLDIKSFVKITILLTFIGICFYYLVLPEIPEMLIDRFTIETLSRDGGSGRTDIWKSALETLKNGSGVRWIIGYGYARLNVYNGYKVTDMMMHNTPLQHLISYGAIGLILYVCLVIKLYKIYKDELKEYKEIFIGLNILSLTLTFGPSYKVFWIIVMLAMMSHKKIQILEES